MVMHTCVGVSLWDWEPWVELEPISRLLWLAFYTSAPSKRILPGLWHGGPSMMGEASRLSAPQVATALQDLIDRNMFEFDKKLRVGRITAPEGFDAFPDTAEFPTNGNTIRSWFGRFNSVPQCSIRDAHVGTLRWLVEQGCKDHGKKKGRPPSHDHMSAWEETFASVQIPSQRRRGVRRVLDEDTSTSAQPSLFSYLEPLPSPVTNPTLSQGLKPYEKGLAEAEAEADTLSSSPEPETNAGEIATGRPRPHLALVPPEALAPFTVDALLIAATGRPAPPDMPVELGVALRRAVQRVGEAGVVAEDLAMIAMARGGNGLRHEKLHRWIADPEHIHEAIVIGQKLKQDQDERIAAFAELRGKLGV